MALGSKVHPSMDLVVSFKEMRALKNYKIDSAVSITPLNFYYTAEFSLSGVSDTAETLISWRIGYFFSKLF
jgi:hypothetical protein